MKIEKEEDFENEVLEVKINEVDPKVVIQIDQFHQGELMFLLFILIQHPNNFS